MRLPVAWGGLFKAINIKIFSLWEQFMLFNQVESCLPTNSLLILKEFRILCLLWEPWLPWQAVREHCVSSSGKLCGHSPHRIVSPGFMATWLHIFFAIQPSCWAVLRPGIFQYVAEIFPHSSNITHLLSKSGKSIKAHSKACLYFKPDSRKGEWMLSRKSF